MEKIKDKKISNINLAIGGFFLYSWPFCFVIIAIFLWLVSLIFSFITFNWLFVAVISAILGLINTINHY